MAPFIAPGNREEEKLELYSTLKKKKNKVFLIYNVIQSGAVAKSPYMRRTLVIHDFATAPF
jgi:hypothetical protein